MINSHGLAGPLPHGVVLLNIFLFGFFLAITVLGTL